MASANRWVVTGKFTEDGANAWRRDDGTWSRTLPGAALHESEAAAKSVIPAVVAKEERFISDPYVIEVYWDGATIDPLSARETVRANGPTVPGRRPDSGVARRK